MGMVTKEATDLESYAASLENTTTTAPAAVVVEEKTVAPTTEVKE